MLSSNTSFELWIWYFLQQQPDEKYKRLNVVGLDRQEVFHNYLIFRKIVKRFVFKGYRDPDPGEKFCIRLDADLNGSGKVEGTGSSPKNKFFYLLVHLHENCPRKQYILSNLPDRTKIDYLGQL